MDTLIIGIIALAGMLILMIIGIPLVYGLGFLAVVGIALAFGEGALMEAGMTPFFLFFNINWTPLPLFILLACIINETRIGTNVFEAASNWFSRLPGGLVVSSIISQAVIASAVGSSTATIVAVGKVAVPEMVRLGYKRSFCMGALCSGGSLGPLIPPSTVMVVYAMLSEASLGKLFIAGFIPGILLTVMLSAYAMAACMINPELAPRPAAVSWKVRISSTWKIWPVLAVMIGVLGGIYLGIMTATEAAGVAVVIILIIAVAFFRLRLPSLGRAIKEAALINVMICFIIIAATTFTYLVGTSGLAKDLTNLVVASNLSPWMVIIAINVLLLILGCFIETITIITLTMPLFIPMIMGLGFDLIWFGVVVVVNIEIALITPPMGLSLFVMKGTFDVPISEVIRGVAPFIVVLIVFLGLVVAFPQLSLWLPHLMK